MLLHFYPTGRLSRWPFFWRGLALNALAFACYGLPALAEHLHRPADFWKNLALAGMLACFYLIIAQAIKRLHDLSLRGWWLLLALVPLGSLVLGGGMQFVAGTAGPNRFGARPR